MHSDKQRLSKFLSTAGVASRRACEEIIFAGRVRVNGETVTIPQTLVNENDKITVDKRPVKANKKNVYFILNKPAGFVCSAAPFNKQRGVLSLFKERKERLFTIGRLDKDTTGLLLVTNDGAFSHAVIHPSANITKEYIAKTANEITDAHLKTIANGTVVEGQMVRPASVKKVRRGTVKVSIKEGKKREVRCLIEHAGLKIRELCRTRIGNLQLGSLPEGQWREMTEREKELIFE